MMTDEAAPTDRRAEEFDRAGIGVRLDEERRRASLLGDIREAIFGAQDGLVSTLAIVSAVSGATDDRYAVLIAGVAAGLTRPTKSQVRWWARDCGLVPFAGPWSPPRMGPSS